MNGLWVAGFFDECNHDIPLVLWRIRATFGIWYFRALIFSHSQLPSNLREGCVKLCTDLMSLMEYCALD